MERKRPRQGRRFLGVFAVCLPVPPACHLAEASLCVRSPGGFSVLVSNSCFHGRALRHFILFLRAWSDVLSTVISPVCFSTLSAVVQTKGGLLSGNVSEVSDVRRSDCTGLSVSENCWR